MEVWSIFKTCSAHESYLHSLDMTPSTLNKNNHKHNMHINTFFQKHCPISMTLIKCSKCSDLYLYFELIEKVKH